MNIQSLKQCHILYYNCTSPYSESAWKQLVDEDIYTCQRKYLTLGIRLYCSFHVLKCPLSLKFYDSEETIALPDNKIHTWLSSHWNPLLAARDAAGHLRTLQWGCQPRVANSL